MKQKTKQTPINISVRIQKGLGTYEKVSEMASSLGWSHNQLIIECIKCFDDSRKACQKSQIIKGRLETPELVKRLIITKEIESLRGSVEKKPKAMIGIRIDQSTKERIDVISRISHWSNNDVIIKAVDAVYKMANEKGNDKNTCKAPFEIQYLYEFIVEQMREYERMTGEKILPR